MAFTEDRLYYLRTLSRFEPVIITCASETFAPFSPMQVVNLTRTDWEYLTQCDMIMKKTYFGLFGMYFLRFLNIVCKVDKCVYKFITSIQWPVCSYGSCNSTQVQCEQEDSDGSSKKHARIQWNSHCCTSQMTIKFWLEFGARKNNDFLRNFPII